MVNNKTKKLNYSENKYDWLGKGMYFWENDPKRALAWAKWFKIHPQNSKQKIKNPAVLGAVICLGNCLDFTEQGNLLKIKKHYEELKKEAGEKGIELPKNSGGKDLYKRELDCFVINSYIEIQREHGKRKVQKQHDRLLEKINNDCINYSRLGMSDSTVLKTADLVLFGRRV